jgi:hypothetical protein
MNAFENGGELSVAFKFPYSMECYQIQWRRLEEQYNEID